MKLTAAQKQEAAARYRDGEPVNSIRKSFGCDFGTVRRSLVAQGVKLRSQSEVHRRYSLRESAFRRVSRKAAYWLGFLMADGGVVPERRSGPHRNGGAAVVLTLSDRDRRQVEQFRRFMGSSHPIRDFQAGGRPYCSLRFASAAVAADLARHGIIPAKSLCAAATVALAADPDFWRGVIDGDGSVGYHRINRRLYPMVKLCGSRQLLEQFRAFVRALSPDCVAAVRPGKGQEWQWRTTGRHALPVLRALYRRPGPALRRKRVAALAALKR